MNAPLPIPDFEAFLSYANDDDLGMVLRCHIALEAVLNTALKSATRDGLRELDRLRFMQKVDVCIALGRLPMHLRGPFEVANKIRNRFAHSLAAEISVAQGEEFLKAFEPSVFDGMLFRSYREARRRPSGTFKAGIGFGTLYLYAATEAGLTQDLLAPYLAARVERNRVGHGEPAPDQPAAEANAKAEGT